MTRPYKWKNKTAKIKKNILKSWRNELINISWKDSFVKQQNFYDYWALIIEFFKLKQKISENF